jgi:hypothetical protein
MTQGGPGSRLLVFQVRAFQRKITLATDASGTFAFNFVPQASDAGTYIVSAIHPDETTLPNQGQFTINRVSFNYSSYSLNAARGFASTIPITARASAGSGVSGVRFVANPADQPSGNLPPGISIESGAGLRWPAPALRSTSVSPAARPRERPERFSSPRWRAIRVRFRAAACVSIIG